MPGTTISKGKVFIAPMSIDWVEGRCLLTSSVYRIDGKDCVAQTHFVKK